MQSLSLLTWGTSGWLDELTFAAGLTFLIALAGFALGALFGALAATAKLSRSRFARGTADVYTTVLRGIPDLLVIYLFYFGGSAALSSIAALFGYTGFVGMPAFMTAALAIGIVFAGDYAIITRSALVETMGHDYVLTARAKGLRAWTIVRRHALRNAALPIVTLVALSLGTVVGGVLVVEYVFSYSGIGLVVVQAIEQRDYPVLQGAFLLLTMAVVLANLAADLIYPRLDPRVVLQ